MSAARPLPLLLAGLVMVAGPARSQDARRSLDLTIGGVGISIGDSRQARGLRVNVRDSRLDRVAGVNATIWSPFEGGHGDITGLALGLPVTGGRRIDGLQIGAFGAEVLDDLRGVAVNGLGIGA
ncbi:MAG: hypothetical protein HUU26_00655, partial [Gemmatimonadaceae bacterium]|nr:hypothetical protein [Gemmatimonadaceae bacterium]